VLKPISKSNPSPQRSGQQCPGENDALNPEGTSELTKWSNQSPQFDWTKPTLGSGYGNQVVTELRVPHPSRSSWRVGGYYESQRNVPIGLQSRQVESCGIPPFATNTKGGAPVILFRSLLWTSLTFRRPFGTKCIVPIISRRVGLPLTDLALRVCRTYKVRLAPTRSDEYRRRPGCYCDS
jgi:hypothetical protein